MSPDSARSVVVVAELRQGELAPVTWELLACARRIAPAAGLALYAVVLGQAVQEAAGRLAAAGAAVTALQGPGLALYNGQAWREVLAQALPSLRPAIVLAAHTTQGLDFAPGLAVRLGAACLTGVERVAVQDGRLLFGRPAWHSKAVAQYAAAAPLSVLTVQPGAFAAEAPAADQAAGSLEVRPAAPLAGSVRFLGLRRAAEQSADLTQAQVVVAAGRGIGKPENLALVQRLAACFSSAAVAGSRPVCDAGWLDYSRQVGITGATVSPQLYIACGISGARQHTAGMQGAGFIVAISLDPQAAIFNLADLCIVEDLTLFIPAFLAECTSAPA
ncbi:MAG: electron transfer flavoprotein subunit alpha/FixB family protein [Desulfarculus sp.]|nr:MAG: electron transfer flavoprotein subunit alpha/FixB family protein [Desulfarculus sp.]